MKMNKVVLLGCVMTATMTVWGQDKIGCPALQVSGEPVLYKEEKVLFRNADTLHFGATLILPLEANTIGGNKKNGKSRKLIPAVILVSGTGPQDRNGTMAGHKLFATIANYLGSRGIAVLRMDDRGVGETNGVYETSTTADFAEDALTAVAYLRSRTDLPLGKIGLMGHSEGGAAISIAASRSQEVDFLISLAGLATDGLSSLLRQNEDLVTAAPIPDYDKRRFNEINRLMFCTAYQYAQSDSLETMLNQVYSEWKVKDDLYFKSLNVGEFDHFRFPIYMYTQQAIGPWYRFFVRYNPQLYLNKVKVPVLALNGDRDVMVDCFQNLGHFKEFLTESTDVTTVALPGLNHLFLPCKKGTPDEYASIQASFSEDALKIIFEWIEKRFL